MIWYRTSFKASWVLMHFWSPSKSWNETKNSFLIMCHGCPSHPYDHVPIGNQKLLKAWYILVYPNYLGTWWSDGECTFDNAVESIQRVINFINEGCAINERTGKQTTWSKKEIGIIWASFWWSVALCVGAISPDITKIISCSPVISWQDHWKDINESSLQETAIFLEKVYNQLWRCSESSLNKFSCGNLNINPISYVSLLRKKQILILHDKNDPQIAWKKIYDFSLLLDNHSKNILYTQNKCRHLLLHHLDERGLSKKVQDFLSK